MGTGPGAKGEGEGALGRLGPRGEMKRANCRAEPEEEAGLQAEKGRESERNEKYFSKFSFLLSFFFFKPNSIIISSILFNLTKNEKFW